MGTLCMPCWSPSKTLCTAFVQSLPFWQHICKGFQSVSLRSMKEVTQLIGSLLGGQVRLFTTRCCQQELKALGADFSGTTMVCFMCSMSLDAAFDDIC